MGMSRLYRSTLQQNSAGASPSATDNANTGSLCGHLFTLHPSTRQLAKTLIIALRALRCLVLLNYVPSLLLGTRSICNDRAFGALWKLMHINDFTTILYASCVTTNRTRVDL